MTVDTQKLGLEACRRWAEVAGLPDDDWRSRAAFVSGYEIGHREALERGIVQEMVAALERVQWQLTWREGVVVEACPLCERTREEGHKRIGDTNGCTAGCDDGCRIGDVLARIRGQEIT